MSEQLSSYLLISAFLLCTGLYGILCRKNVIAILISIELILNAANLNFVAFNRFLAPDKGVGQVISLFVIALAAAEACIALSIVLLISRRHQTVLVDKLKDLKG